jgi:hypothetical protein
MQRLLAAAILFTGCTHWSTTNVYGQRYEVERRMLGSPAVEETNSSSLSGGFASSSASETDRYRHHTTSGGSLLGSFGGDSSSSRMTHCVQQAEIHYKQPYRIVPVKSGRTFDVIGSVAAITTGLMIMFIADIQSQTSIPMSSPIYSAPPSATPGLILGGVAIAGGIGLLAYSFGKLPHGTPPPVEDHEDDVVETEFVEATGCGLPGDPTNASR